MARASIQIAARGQRRQADGAAPLQRDGVAQFAERMLQVFDLSLQFAHVAPMLPALPFERLPRDFVRFDRVGEHLRHDFENISVLFREQSPNVVGDKAFEAGVEFAFLRRLGPASVDRIKVGVISAGFR